MRPAFAFGTFIRHWVCLCFAFLDWDLCSSVRALSEMSYTIWHWQPYRCVSVFLLHQSEETLKKPYMPNTAGATGSDFCLGGERTKFSDWKRHNSSAHQHIQRAESRCFPFHHCCQYRYMQKTMQDQTCCIDRTTGPSLQVTVNTILPEEVDLIYGSYFGVLYS